MYKVVVFFFTLFCATIAVACESNSYKIHYLPIEAEFYTPPTREYILKNGVQLEVESCEMTTLFQQVSVLQGVEPQDEDYKGLRIVIMNEKTGGELFITTDKKIICADKLYNIDVKLVDDAVMAIKNFIKSNKRAGVGRVTPAMIWNKPE